MTENKRFTVEDDDADIWENNHFLAVAYNHNNAKKITKRLNKLSDENDELRQELICEKPLFTKKRLHQENQQLTEENEQLKSTINTLTHDNTKMKKVLNNTKNENEQIKQVIKEAYHNERTELGKSVLKQLLNNIEG